MPGKKDIHHAVSTRFLPSDTITPQDGVGGGMPSPRKLNVASVIIIIPTDKVIIMINGLIMFGKICLIMILNEELPIIRACATKSASFNLRASPLIKRA